MRVTLVTETYAPQVNGVSRTLGQLVRVLRASGDVVQLIHPDYGEPREAPHDLLVRSMRMPFYRELLVPLPPFGSVRRAIDAFQPDLIHIATEATLGLAALNHASSSSIPVVSSFHTNFDQYTNHYGVGGLKGLIWRYLRWFHNRTLETYVPSRTTIGELEGKGFERLVLWARGVDARLFRPDRPRREAIRTSLGFGPDHVVIGHVSRIAVEKNVTYLGHALAMVVKQRPLARLLIVGDGPARPELEATLGEGARFVGYRSGEDLADHYAAADLFAFASLTETFGNVILEAMASALPVVAIRSGGPSDIVIDGETGRLIAPDQPPETFARALVELIDDPLRRKQMSEQARKHATSQSWEAIMKGLRERYAMLVSESPTAPLPVRPSRVEKPG